MNQEEQELQEKYMEMKTIEEQMKEIHQQGQAVEQQLIELINANQGLDDFKKTEKGKEILVPISSGIFAKANIKENNKFLVNVGADTVVEKDIESTKDLLEKQIKELKKLHEHINIQMQKLAINASVIEQELKEMASKLQ